jgi:2-keto-4-pentenoate hydratase
VVVAPVDLRLASALNVQLQSWRVSLLGGATRVGWKLGVGDRERIGPGLVVGHLTSATQLDPGEVYRPKSGSALHADAEVALVISGDVPSTPDVEMTESAIAGYAAALELVDLAAPPDDPESIIAANVFHCAFALGPTYLRPPLGSTEGGLTVNGEPRASAAAAQDFVDLLQSAAVLLDTVGQRLQEATA